VMGLYQRSPLGSFGDFPWDRDLGHLKQSTNMFGKSSDIL